MRKKILALTFGISLIIMGSAFWYWSGKAMQTYNADNLIRFHVIANSDSEADQALKLEVRDAVVRAMTPKVGGIRNAEEAREVVRANVGMIQEVSRKQVQRSGYDYPVRVYYGRYPFPDRVYGSWKVPAGEYEAVRVVIGEGSGQNWWCVLFPPLCFVSGGQDGAVAAAAAGEMAPPVEVRLRFKAADLWREGLNRVLR
ncbi:stage II sporulation protein R [Desulforudis sp. 1088]|uniref:stage II sporulation protein R n=2 Tax=Candidatus Desulforudis TaxID=471826 RepID=UPI003CE5BC2F